MKVGDLKLSDGQRRCIRCRKPFKTGSSPVTRSCAACHAKPLIASDGNLRCDVCGKEVAFSEAVSKRFCDVICRREFARKRRNTLRGRLNLCLQKARARRECSIDLEWLLGQWERQSGRCFYTGWEMQLLGDVALRPTIERLDSSLGYTPNNVVICCKQVNWAKNNYSLDAFLRMCRAVALVHSEDRHA